MLGPMHGMREASRDFTEFFADVLVKHLSFKRGLVERCLFVHDNSMRVAAHIDDPIVTGSDECRNHFWKELSKHVVLKRGHVLSCTETAAFLGREYQLVRECGWRGFRARHPQAAFDGLAKEAGLDSKSKAMSTPGVVNKDDDKSRLKEEVNKVDAEKHKAYRSLVGRMQWVKP